MDPSILKHCKPTADLNDLQQFLVANYPFGCKKVNLSSEYQAKIGEKGVCLLIEYFTWSIESINLSMHALGDSGMQHLIRKSKHWRQCKSLTLTNNFITSAGMIGFNELPWPQLEAIVVNRNHMDSQFIEILLKGSFTNLKKLTLGGNCISSEGCALLSRTDWPYFQRLDLNYNLIEDEGMKYLSYANWPQIKQLNIANNRLSGRAMCYIRDAPWHSLALLILNRNKIGIVDSKYSDVGCVYLAQIPSKSLIHFAIFGNNISYNGIALILRSGKMLPNCFLELAKNCFTFADVSSIIEEQKLFCNKFDNSEN